ncbi:MAG TPA: hypothetical protein VFZ47_13350 [Chitinophagaceae bacterium]
MSIRSAIQRIPVWLRITIGFVLLLLLGGAIGINIYLNNLVNKRLREMVYESSDGLYRLEYRDIDMNAFSGNITIYNAELIPDTAVYVRLQQAHRAPRFLVGGKTDKLSLKNVRWFAFMNNKKLKIGRLLIERPEFNLVQYRPLRRDTVNKSPGVSEFISKNVRDLSLNVFSIHDAVIHYQVADTVAKERTFNTIEHLDIGFTKVHFAGDDTATRHLVADDYFIDLKEYKHRTADSLYWVTITGFRYNSNQRKATLDSFIADPRYSEANFSKKLGYQETRYEAALKNISVEGFDIAALIEENELRMKNMNIESGSAYFYMNRAYPPPREDIKNVVISQRILNLDIPLLIDSFSIANLGLTYKEYNPLSGRAGVLKFENVSGKAVNVTNLPAVIAKQPHMKVNINARLLGSGVRASLRFDLDKPDGRFNATLEADQIAAEQLNGILAPMALIEARQGIMQKLECNISGTANRAAANVKLLYEDLKIDILKKEGKTLEKKGLKSVFANILVFDDNPKDGTLRTARQVQKSRRYAKSFFNLAWSTVAAGIMEIIFKEKGINLQS